MKVNILNIIKKSSIFLLMNMILILLITTILFFTKISISNIHLPIIYVLTIVLFLIFYKKDKIKNSIISILVATVIFISSIVAIGNIYDSTADGNTYHKLAVGSLKNGWNPVYESVLDFSKEEGNTFDVSKKNVNVNWVDHYAKATEIYASVIYAFTGNIETGKVYTILLMYIMFGIVFTYLNQKKKMNVVTSIIISILLTVNPITIVQICNYYVDAALMISIFLILYACIVETEGVEGITRIENFIILFSAVVLCINIKFTGICFSGAFCAVFYFYWLYKNLKEHKKEGKNNVKIHTIFYIITVIVSFAIVGFSSYTKNMIDHKNPLYPLYGENHVANMVMMEAPSSMQDKNHLEVFLISIFSKSENVSPSYSDANVQPTLKIPFSILKGEIDNFSIPDIRMGGFGPWFSGIFILSIIGIIYIIIDLIRNRKWNYLIPYILVLLTVFALALIFDGGYWARYIPYLYFIPISILIYLLIDKKDKCKFILGMIFSVIMIINILFIMKSAVKTVINNNEYIKNKLQLFSEYSKENEYVEVKLNHIGLQGVLYNIDDLEIDNYIINQDLTEGREGYFFSYKSDGERK